MLDTYLLFSGNCGEAMRFYEKVLGAKMETFMTFGDSPQPEMCPTDAKDLVMHACLLLDGRRIMASDTPAEMGPKPMAGFAVSLNYDTAEEARRIFDALSAGGSVTMPMQKTFWAESFGSFTDRFGTPWMLGGGLSHPG
jgi:PhnB protein